MRRSILNIPFLLLLLLISSCGPEGNKFKIEGKFRDMKEGELYIYNLSDRHARFDTLKVKGGSFVYQGEAEGPSPYMLVFPNAVEQVIFVDAGKILEYEASTTDLKNYTVKGSDENKLMNEFRHETRKMTAIKVKAAAREFIENHPASAVSVYMLDRYFAQDENIVADELKQLVSMLLKYHPNNVFLIDLQTSLRLIDRSSINKILPKMELTTKTGKKMDLASIDKSYRLVAFWATWMDEEWDFMPKVRKYARGYGDNLSVLAISLDTQVYRWEEYVDADSLLFDNVCDGLGWDSPSATKLGVRNIPYYVLADNKGKIIANGTNLKDMDRDVEKFVPKNASGDSEPSGSERDKLTPEGEAEI